MAEVFTPHHGGQVEVLADTHRFQTLRAGRRWGKTKVGARKLLRKAINEDDQLCWWVANSYRNVRRGYAEVVRQLPRELLAKPAPAATAQELVLTLVTGSRIEFYSAGNPDALAGAGVDSVVGDEAALWPHGEELWFQLIRPTLMDTGGDALLISTPRGRNWFYRQDMKGYDPAEVDFQSWHFPQSDNPYIPQEETDSAKAEMPDVMFRQEIMAEYVSSAASIFDLDYEGSVVPLEVEPRGHVYVGVDFGKQNDFTVITASRAEDRMPCHHERFNAIKWPIQRERLADAVAMIEGYPGVTGTTVCIDATGMGDVVFDDLEDEGMDVIGIKFTNQWKRQAVRQLAADLQQGRAHILEEQRPEFETYEYTITDSGNYKFEAALGHDDEVSAKLLEHWELAQGGGGGMRTADEIEDEVEDGVIEEVTLTRDDPIEMMERPEVWEN